MEFELKIKANDLKVKTKSPVIRFKSFFYK